MSRALLVLLLLSCGSVACLGTGNNTPTCSEALAQGALLAPCKRGSPPPGEDSADVDAVIDLADAGTDACADDAGPDGGCSP